jgi:photosystem II stability/assembly factor-like uncharacterized protein
MRRNTQFGTRTNTLTQPEWSRRAQQLRYIVSVLLLFSSSVCFGLDGLVSGIYFLDDANGWVKLTQHLLLGKEMPLFSYLETHDGGKHWETIEAGRIYRRFRKGMYFIDDREGWSVEGGFDDSGAVFHTVDGGKIWSKRFITTSYGFRTVQFVDRMTGWVAGTAIYQTVDGGQTWNATLADTSKKLDIASLVFLHKNQGWLAGSYFGEGKGQGVVLETSNAGQTWTMHRIRGDSDPVGDVFFINEHLGWVVAGIDTKIFRTNDGGKTWKDIYTFGSSKCVNSIHFVNESLGWAAGVCGPIIFKTTDGGETWSRQF